MATNRVLRVAFNYFSTTNFFNGLWHLAHLPFCLSFLFKEIFLLWLLFFHIYNLNLYFLLIVTRPKSIATLLSHSKQFLDKKNPSYNLLMTRKHTIFLNDCKTYHRESDSPKRKKQKEESASRRHITNIPNGTCLHDYGPMYSKIIFVLSFKSTLIQNLIKFLKNISTIDMIFPLFPPNHTTFLVRHLLI